MAFVGFEFGLHSGRLVIAERTVLELILCREVSKIGCSPLFEHGFFRLSRVRIESGIIVSVCRYGSPRIRDELPRLLYCVGQSATFHPH